MLTFYFTGVEGRMTRPELLTSGMMGKELRLEFSEEWEELTKTVVFSNGETTLDRLYTGQTMVIPAQILEKPLEKLTVGIYGVSADGLLVIPTIRAEGPVILPGVDPTGDPGMDPSLPVWDQLQITMDQLQDQLIGEKENLMAAIQELTDRIGKSPTVDYYGSMASAISDINNGVTVQALPSPDGAKIVVFTAHTGAKTVLLLADVSESAALVINKDVDLVLNGKKLNLVTNTAVLNFGAGTKCRIHGEIPGSEIIMEGISPAENTVMMTTNGDMFEVHGGKYSMKANSAKRMTAFLFGPSCGSCKIYEANIYAENMGGQIRAVQCQAVNGAFLDGVTINAAADLSAYGIFCGSDIAVHNCKVSVVSDREYGFGIVTYQGKIFRGVNSEIKAASKTNSASALRVKADSTAYFENCNFHGDSTDCHVQSNYSVGVDNFGQCHLRNCTVFGTHSGASTNGALYVNGGVYTGFCHGGIYAGGNSSAIAYVNDAVLQDGNYQGMFDYSEKTGDIYGSMYIGGSSESNGVSVYLDGCTIATVGAHAIVMRGTDGEHDNTVHISNSTVIGTIRIDNDTLKLMVGAGTNITVNKIDNPKRAEFTEQLYRKNSADKILDGRDYEVLAERLAAAPGSVKTVGGLAADQNGNVPLDWVATKTFEPKVILEESSVSGGFTTAFGYEDLEGQEELAILCDGRLYLCVPEFGYDSGDGYYVHLGNKALISSGQTDSGEPFLVWGFKGASLMLAFRVSGSHIMSISGYEYVYSKLPAQYLPEQAIRDIVAAVLAESRSG